ncbi:hypothetical protein EJB05_13866, partial [Eragrostis curvula]
MVPKRQCQILETMQHLQQLLLRVRVIIEEAEGWHITNQAMAHQLNMLRKGMCRGYFTINTMRCQCIETSDHDVSYSFARSVFNPTKRIFLSNGDTHGAKDLKQVLDNLNNIMIHVSEFVTFLNKCPPLCRCRQPYNMHLFVGKCMFGRQMETHRILDFLMQMEHPSTKIIGVLPIVGPTCVGKSTIVAHVCDDICYENFATMRDQRLLTIILNSQGTLMSVKSRDHPKLESVAMEMARGMKGSFMAANITSGFQKEQYCGPTLVSVPRTFQGEYTKELNFTVVPGADGFKVSHDI